MAELQRSGGANVQNAGHRYREEKPECLPDEHAHLLASYNRAMIDCHAHAYPRLDELAGRVASRLSAPAAPLVTRGAAALGSASEAVGRWLGKRSRGPAIDIERVAAMRRARTERANRVFEGAMSTVALPALLATGTVERLLASMDRRGIDATVLIGAPPIATNDWLLDRATAAGNGRLVPVTTLPPLDDGADEAAWRDAFEQLAGRGARGFKIHPNMDGLPADHVAYRALFAAADAHGRFVIVHTGCFHVPAYKRHGAAEPNAFEPLFQAFPKVPVCLAHMNREHPEAAWDVMERHSQLFADTSWQPADAIRRAVDRVGVDRVLLGSDWPLLHGDLQADALEVLRRAVTADEAERIGRDNARRFLGTAAP